MIWTRCPVCDLRVQRNSAGQLLPHTRLAFTPGRAGYPVICEAYTRGARAT